jgi:hypothetical protein
MYRSYAALPSPVSTGSGSKGGFSIEVVVGSQESGVLSTTPSSRLLTTTTMPLAASEV